MDIKILKTEIDTDPLTRGYSGMSDEEVASSFNTIDRTLPRTSIPTMELFARFDKTEYNAQVIVAADSKKATAIGHLLSMGNIDPSNVVVQQIVKDVFGTGSATIKNLIGAVGGDFNGDDLRTTNVSRATELGIGLVRPGNVTEAKQ